MTALSTIPGTDGATSALPALQLAALCHRRGDKGVEILLVSSSRGRWILPKGWPVRGQSGRETALQEAWEEGGVRKGKAAKSPLASYLGVKRFDDGNEIPCKTKVFMVRVRDMARKFPEAERRKRIWVSPRKAAKLVDDPALKKLLRSL